MNLQGTTVRYFLNREEAGENGNYQKVFEVGDTGIEKSCFHSTLSKRIK